jgi:hypothetical protein
LLFICAGFLSSAWTSSFYSVALWSSLSNSWGPCWRSWKCCIKSTRCVFQHSSLRHHLCIGEIVLAHWSPFSL